MAEVSVHIFREMGEYRTSVDNDRPLRFIPPEIYLSDYLKDKVLSEEIAVIIGHELFERVFNTEERKGRFKDLVDNLSATDRLNISIISDDQFIHEIPWEVLSIDRGEFLLKNGNISLLRNTTRALSFKQSLNLPRRLLVALSLPIETYRKAPLDVLREINIIYKALDEFLGDGTVEIGRDRCT